MRLQNKAQEVTGDELTKMKKFQTKRINYYDRSQHCMIRQNALFAKCHEEIDNSFCQRNWGKNASGCKEIGFTWGFP